MSTSTDGPRRYLATLSSRAAVTRPTHWALVCRTDEALDVQASELKFRKCDVRNIASGKHPADQQNTTAVRYSPDPGDAGRAYGVRVRAILIAPYLIALREPVAVPDDIRRSAAHAEPASALALLLTLVD